MLVLFLVLAVPAAGQSYVREFQSPNLGTSAWGGSHGYDVDGSGHPNLWGRGAGRVIIYNADYQPWWTINCAGHDYPMLAIPRDVDGDGLVRPVDLNGDGTGEVVVGAYRVDGGSFSGRFWVYDAVTRQLQYESPDLPGFIGSVQLDDVDGDGRHEMIITRYDHTAGWGYVEVYGYEGSGVAGPGEYRRRTGTAQALPTVTRAGTEVGYELVAGGFTRLRLFDAAGREVRQLVRAELPPGRYAVRWDGRDETGRELPAGSYSYRLEASGQVEAGRLILAR